MIMEFTILGILSALCFGFFMGTGWYVANRIWTKLLG